MLENNQDRIFKDIFSNLAQNTHLEFTVTPEKLQIIKALEIL